MCSQTDANAHGVLPRKNRRLRRNGLRARRRSRSIYGIRMFPSLSLLYDSKAKDVQMQYDTPLSTNPTAAKITSLPLREQLRQGFKDLGSRSYSSAKNFGKVGAIFAGTECCIEGFRAKNDLKNGVMAGCITGGVLAAPAGPQAAALGCAGFAAFSLAIDAYMRRPSETD